MAESSKARLDESDTKRRKTHHDGYPDEERKYRIMLDRTGQCFRKEDIMRLTRLGGLSPNETSEILQGDEGHPDKLFAALERKALIQPNNIVWLKENLLEIENKAALAHVEECATFKIADEVVDLPSEPETESSDEGDAGSSTFRDFLTDLGLGKMFPCKLTLNDFLKVKDKVDPKKSVHFFWQKLTSLDYRAGYPQNYVCKFSMRDFIIAVLHCADDFLRQDILEKMAACQLAVPIIIPGIEGVKPQFLLWALRRIIKKWKGNCDSYASEQLIATYPIFTVSVLRIGPVRVSKSNLLNTMLGYSQGNSLHSFFLSMEKDIVKPHFSLGSIDCVWFLPQYGNDNAIFQEVTAFFNVRGDCSKHEAQTEFACKAANLTIALISTDKRDKYRNVINQINKNSSKTLFIAVKEEDRQLPTPQKVYNPRFKEGWLFVKILQVDVLSRHICQHIIQTYPMDTKQYKSLETLAQLCSHDIQIDEHKKICKDAKYHVNTIFESVSLDNIIEFKRLSFPLQKCWVELVHFDKDASLSGEECGESFEHQAKVVQTKKVKVREEQIHAILSKPVKRYHKIVSSNKNNSNMLNYIFGYLQDEIYKMVNRNTLKDTKKMLELEEQIQIYKRSTSNFDTRGSVEETSNQKPENTTESTYQSQQCALKDLIKQTNAKQLGCEHFLRELGQLFEAFKETEAQERCGLAMADITLLPALAARLVLEMHSLELMDGDAGSVPLIWITNVLDTLTLMLHDPKVLVISAIGVQSSGKSTLLNSMFGLKFPVRAGRCTRGLFIRLLQLDESLVDELGLNYMVIVDTEGIRSIEHDDQRFDNELVTLALSIANITIFNIEGENIGPDMTGILQIAAHALMRMKEVDIECQCRIVQQRVSDLTAADRNKANTHRIMETLDEATKIAAEEEGLEGRYQRFRDVVHLHVDEALQYIPCLWAGGMSPPNHMYSEIVTKIKAKLIQDIRDGTIIPDMTLSTFTERVRDVWQAVQKEDFVFNFQDSVKAVDYNKLCLNYNKWIIRMRFHMMLATDSCYAIIDGNIGKILQPENQESKSTADQCDNGSPHIEELKIILSKEARMQEDNLIRSIDDYIEQHLRKHALLKYKSGFIEDLKLVMRDVENEASASVQDEYELNKIRRDLPTFRNEWRVKLSAKAKNLASLASDDDENLNLFRFENNWTKWMSSITDSRKQWKRKVSLDDLQGICENLLLRVTRGMAVGSEIRHLMSEEGGINKHAQLCDCRPYTHDKFVRAWLMQVRNDETRTSTEAESIENERARALSYVHEVIEKNLNEMVEGHRGKSFDENIFQLMLQRTLKDLTERPQFKLPHILIAKGLLYLSCKAFQHLIVSRNKCPNDCTFLLQGVKEDIYQDFRAFLKNDRDMVVVRAAESIYYYIQPIYKEKALDTLKKFKEEIQIDFIDELRVERPWDILRFIVNSGISSQIYYIRESYNNTILNDIIVDEKARKLQEKLKYMLVVKINELVDHLLKTIKYIDSSKSTPFKNWLDSLSKKTMCPSLQHVYSLYEIEDFIDVSNHLQQIINDRLLESLSPNMEDSMILGVFLHACSFNFLNVCQATCPLCGVPCDNVLTHHTVHFSFLHRPRGYRGETCSSKLITEDCSASVASKTATFVYNGIDHPCHQYQSVYSNWRITPSSTNYGLTFWQWSMTRDNEILASTFECQKADIPETWYRIDKESALCSLDLDQEAKLNGRQAAIASNSFSKFFSKHRGMYSTS